MPCQPPPQADARQARFTKYLSGVDYRIKISVIYRIRGYLIACFTASSVGSIVVACPAARIALFTS
ncbi:MAG: hypothetical protein AAB427_07675, partial [Chloroflexota bacterium]